MSELEVRETVAGTLGLSEAEVHERKYRDSRSKGSKGGVRWQKKRQK
jgi:hypothetical protein